MRDLPPASSCREPRGQWYRIELGSGRIGHHAPVRSLADGVYTVKIVLAEDIGVTRRLFEETLLDIGHEVTAVGDGDAALAAVNRVRPPLVILDWLMPKLDGLQVCSRIREMDGGRELFILMQTGRGTSEDLAAALACGSTTTSPSR